MNNHIPVSYTHLDVYKRQVYYISTEDGSGQAVEPQDVSVYEALVADTYGGAEEINVEYDAITWENICLLYTSRRHGQNEKCGPQGHESEPFFLIHLPLQFPHISPPTHNIRRSAAAHG